MDVVVTGSSGLIGTALKGALEGAGHRMVPMVRSQASGERIHWDPDRGEIDSGGLEGVGAVVHLAGEGIGNRRWNDAHKAKVKESRRRGTSLLAETLAKLDKAPKVLVSGSAVGYYGDRGDEVLTESSRPGSDFLAEVCTAWEAAAAPAKEAGIRVAHIRTGIVLSGRGGVLPKMLLPFKFGVGGKLGSGEQWMSWIALEDEVGAIVHLLGDEAPARALQPHGSQPGHQRRHDEGDRGGARTARPHPGAGLRPQGRARAGRWRRSCSSSASGRCRPGCSTRATRSPSRTRRCAPGRAHRGGGQGQLQVGQQGQDRGDDGHAEERGDDVVDNAAGGLATVDQAAVGFDPEAAALEAAELAAVAGGDQQGGRVVEDDLAPLGDPGLRPSAPGPAPWPPAWPAGGRRGGWRRWRRAARSPPRGRQDGRGRLGVGAEVVLHGPELAAVLDRAEGAAHDRELRRADLGGRHSRHVGQWPDGEERLGAGRRHGVNDRPLGAESGAPRPARPRRRTTVTEPEVDPGGGQQTRRPRPPGAQGRGRPWKRRPARPTGGPRRPADATASSTLVPMSVSIHRRTG